MHTYMWRNSKLITENAVFKSLIQSVDARLKRNDSRCVRNDWRTPVSTRVKQQVLDKPGQQIDITANKNWVRNYSRFLELVLGTDSCAACDLGSIHIGDRATEGVIHNPANPIHLGTIHSVTQRAQDVWLSNNPSTSVHACRWIWWMRQHAGPMMSVCQARDCTIARRWEMFAGSFVLGQMQLARAIGRVNGHNGGTMTRKDSAGDILYGVSSICLNARLYLTGLIEHSGWLSPMLVLRFVCADCALGTHQTNRSISVRKRGSRGLISAIHVNFISPADNTETKRRKTKRQENKQTNN